MPKRIQRKRTKGWRMPEGAVYVGRPSKFGNPFRVGGHYRRGGDRLFGGLAGACIYVEAYEGHQDANYTTLRTAAEAVEWFRWYLLTRWSADERWAALRHLRGKDLLCWCPLDQPCHADVLLELANSVAGGDREASR